MRILVAKMCSRCHVVRTLSDFSPNKEGRGGVQTRCRPCLALGARERREADPEGFRERAKEWRERNPEIYRRQKAKASERIRAAYWAMSATEREAWIHEKYERGRDRWLRRYGITQADYDAMFERQGGLCALCGRDEDPRGLRFAVDHDHETGRVRGLLCTPCNRTLGFAEFIGLDVLTAYLEVKGGG